MSTFSHTSCMLCCCCCCGCYVSWLKLSVLTSVRAAKCQIWPFPSLSYRRPNNPLTWLAMLSLGQMQKAAADGAMERQCAKGTSCQCWTPRPCQATRLLDPRQDPSLPPWRPCGIASRYLRRLSGNLFPQHEVTPFLGLGASQNRRKECLTELRSKGLSASSQPSGECHFLEF